MVQFVAIEWALYWSAAAHAHTRRRAFPFARNTIFGTSGVCQSMPWEAADVWWGEAVRCLRTTNHPTSIETLYLIIKAVALPTPSLFAHKTSQTRGTLMILTTLWRTTTEAISRACAESSWRNRGSDLCVSPLYFYIFLRHVQYVQWIEMASYPIALWVTMIVVFSWMGSRYYLQTGMFVNLTPASSIFIVNLIKSTKSDVSCSWPRPKQLASGGSPLLEIDLLRITVEDLKVVCPCMLDVLWRAKLSTPCGATRHVAMSCDEIV